MKLATINLNGNTAYNLINIKGNIQPDLEENLETIKAYVNSKMIEEFIDEINTNEYDIIAVQELLNEDNIKKQIQDNGYRIYQPKILTKRTRFLSAFIVKESFIENDNYEIQNIDLNLIQYKNRFVEIILKSKDSGTILKLFNVHIPKERTIFESIIKLLKPDEENIILLGDFNAASDKQRNDESNKQTPQKIIDENNNFLADIAGKGFENMGEDKDFTFITVKEVKNKIDHIYFSNTFTKKNNLDGDEKKENRKNMVNLGKKVNFMEDRKNGFTDHSILKFEINLE